MWTCARPQSSLFKMDNVNMQVWAISRKTSVCVCVCVSVSQEPALNGSILFDKILSCFLETTDQSHKSCREACSLERILTSSCL